MPLGDVFIIHSFILLEVPKHSSSSVLLQSTVFIKYRQGFSEAKLGIDVLQSGQLALRNVLESAENHLHQPAVYVCTPAIPGSTGVCRRLFIVPL